MVHEVLGLRNNRVDLKHVPGLAKELQVLTSDYIGFYSLKYFVSTSTAFLLSL
jgi:hypothetical protein